MPPVKKESAPAIRQRSAHVKSSEGSLPAKIDSVATMSFGVGCFHFASLRDQEKLDEKTYIQDLKDYLLKDKLVKDFSFTKKPYSSFIAERENKRITDDISDSDGLLNPYLYGYVLKFEIHIQEECRKNTLAASEAEALERIL